MHVDDLKKPKYCRICDGEHDPSTAHAEVPERRKMQILFEDYEKFLQSLLLTKATRERVKKAWIKLKEVKNIPDQRITVPFKYELIFKESIPGSGSLTIQDYKEEIAQKVLSNSRSQELAQYIISDLSDIPATEKQEESIKAFVKWLRTL